MSMRPRPRAPAARGPLSALGAVLLLAACGDDGVVGFDDNGPCWPLQASPGGQVELGTGEIDFEPMPDMLAITSNTSQSDPYFGVHARIRGMPPGSRDDPFDPKNPRTKVSAVIEELNLTLGVECPATLGYVASPEPGAYDLVHSLRLGFGTFPIEQVSGKQARVTVEVVGANRLYARAEKMVTLMAP
jgi:hypothetical protein